MVLFESMIASQIDQKGFSRGFLGLCFVTQKKAPEGQNRSTPSLVERANLFFASNHSQPNIVNRQLGSLNGLAGQGTYSADGWVSYEEDDRSTRLARGIDHMRHLGRQELPEEQR